MVEYSILNTKSLPFSSLKEFEVKFKDILEIFRFLKEKNYYKCVKSPKDVRGLEIVRNMDLSKLMGNLDRDMKSRVRSFIVNEIMPIEFPIIESEEDFGLREYKYLGENVDEIGYADIFNTLLISFNSDERWNKEKLKLKRVILDEEGICNEKEIEIYNVAVEDHLKLNKDFFKKVDKEKIETLMKDFKKNYKDIFKKIKFSDEIVKNIKKIDKVVLKEAMVILYQIEIGQKEIKDFNCSGESKTVRKNPKYKEERRVKMEDGEIVYMYNHIKNLSKGNRIYFFEKSEKIYIGYIGEHLKTAKF